MSLGRRKHLSPTLAMATPAAKKNISLSSARHAGTEAGEFDA
jgi:hypothetical protein